MAFSTAVQYSSAASATINIAPLVDVMLVLLIIFMVTMPMVSAPLQAALPQPTANTHPAPEPLLLQVNDAGQFALEGQFGDDAQMSQRLAAVALENPRTTLRIPATGSADYQRLVQALSLAQQAGFSQIAIQH